MDEAEKAGLTVRSSGVWRKTRPGLVAGAALAAALSLAAAPGAARAAARATSAAGGVTVTLPGVTVEGIAVSDGTAYLSAEPTTGRGHGNVYVIDLATGAVTATIGVGDDPGPIVVVPWSNQVYVGNRGDDTLTWIVVGSTSTSTQTLVLPTGQSPTSLMYYPVDMDYLYVGTTSQGSASISNYVVGWSGAPVQAITPMTTLTMPGADSAELGPYDVYAYGAFGGPSVREYTALAGLPFGSGTMVDLPSRPVSLLPGYVVEANGTVLAFDPYNAVPGTSVRVPLGPVVSSTTDAPFNSAYSVYVTGRGSGGASVVYQINEADTSVVGEIPVPGPGYVAAAGTSALVYAANAASGATVMTIPVATSVIPVTAPVITSTARAATFTTGRAGSLKLTATGTPAPAFTESGRLPAGVTLGSAGLLNGTPKFGTGGVYKFTISAGNVVRAPVTEEFTLAVHQRAAITSANHATIAQGKKASFTVRTTGYPAATIRESGALPAGVKFTMGKQGTATISGIPAKSAKGRRYVIRLAAGNGVGATVTQRFTLTVS
jgi:YVTN family beta-propeller protein